ncbi:DUF305 domain-containing protein [Streptomyces sannanensis]|uniref:DUF305 domain-containing protein n=1 Tax=Streptomyces sannanensis TaxID=285536 RepID=A0ABP6S8R6_9ACTN
MKHTTRIPRTYWAAAAAVVIALQFAGWAAYDAATADDGPGAAAATPSENSADAGFARDMAVHHQQAVEMSLIVRDRTDDEDVRRLAYDIANTQANQRGMLLGWLDLWGLPKVSPGSEPMAWMGAQTHHGHHGPSGAGALMPGMATKAELEQLRRASGKQAEILYLQLMTDHHKGGVHMAQGCADRCTVDVERKLAQGMVDAQESELDLMARMLQERGAKPRS